MGMELFVSSSFGFGELHLLNVLRRGESGVLLENLPEVRIAHVQLFGDLLGADGFELISDQDLCTADLVDHFGSFEDVVLVVGIGQPQEVIDDASRVPAGIPTSVRWRRGWPAGSAGRFRCECLRCRSVFRA